VGILAALMIWRDDLVRRDNVDDLEACLSAGHNRFLAGDHDHRHGA
jgi:hypothetical protein